MGNGRANGVKVPMAVPDLSRPQRPQLASLGNDPARFESDAEPAFDLVLLRLLEVDSGSKIQAPDGVKLNSEPERWQVVKVGPGAYNLTRGEMVPLDKRLKPGQVVYPALREAAPFQVGKVKYVVVPATGILLFSNAPPEPLPA